MDRVRAAAARDRRSLNEFLTLILGAATDPEFVGDDVERVRERLARAGLLASPGVPRQRPDGERLAAARRAAGEGTSLAELVSDDRE